MLMNHTIDHTAPNAAAAVTVHCLADDAAHSAKIEPIAGLIYKADPHIYPGAFGEDTAFATKVIAHFLHHAVSYFQRRNVYFAVCNSEVAGVMVLLRDADFAAVDCDEIRKTFPALPHGFEYACREVFNTAGNDVSERTMYLCSLAVDERFRRRHVGKQMLETILLRNPEKGICLHVLCENEPAIGLYKACGFDADELNVHDGFSVSGPRPKFFKMERRAAV